MFHIFFSLTHIMKQCTIAELKTQLESPKKSFVLCRVVSRIDMDTFVIADATGTIVFDTSNQPNLQRQVGNNEFIKIFAPVIDGKRLTASSSTCIVPTNPIPITEELNLEQFVSTIEYKTVEETRELKNPTRVNMILKFISMSEPKALQFGNAVYATALDSAGHEIKISMYTQKWINLSVGKTYQAHHVQLDHMIVDGIHQLRTIADTSFMEAPAHLQIHHTEDLRKMVNGTLLEHLELRLYLSCPKCHKSLANIQGDICPNGKCKASIEEDDKVRDFTVLYIFDDGLEDTEIEKIVFFRRTLQYAIKSFADEAELTQSLKALENSIVSIKFSNNRNLANLRIVESITFP